MLQKYSFFSVFALLLTGLHWWSSHVDVSVEASTQLDVAAVQAERESNQASASQTELRRELMESLDRLVNLENYYHSIYGYYTQVLSHAGFSLAPRLAQHYEIQVTTVGKDRFQVSAFSEERGRMQDRVWVDQSFHINANFSLPAPSAEYLKLRAVQQLRLSKEQDHALPEQGIYTGYFRYEFRRDSEGHSVPMAIGIKSPVVGVELESGASHSLLGEAHDSPDVKNAQVSPATLPEDMSQYAKEWSQLAQYAQSEWNEPLEIGAGEAVNRNIAALPPSVTGSQVKAPSDRLIIESISQPGSANIPQTAAQ